MYTFNGFVSIPELANNRVGQIAKFGELSVISKTYSRDIRNFVNKAQYPALELVSFSILDNNSATVTNPPGLLTTKALAVANFLYTQYTNNRIPLNSAKATLITAITNEVRDIRNVNIGLISDGETTGKRLIDYIRYDYVVDNKEFRCTLWFSDAAFRTQYPLYEVEIIPPVGDITRLNNSPAMVAEALNSVTVDYVVNRISAITRNHPATAYYTYDLKWKDPNGSNTELTTKWTLVIYGAAGNDQDVIKDSIREYLATNSNGVDWPRLFPDLYSENEFLIMPYWGNLSTPTNGYDDGLYSSITTQAQITKDIDRLLPASYGTGANKKAHLDKAFAILGTPYRGMNLAVVGNPNNRGELYQFLDKFPDYMSVSTDKSDFSRMNKKTQEFILLLLTTLEVCRDFTLNTQLGPGYAKAVKGNREYIGFEYDGFKYYILTRMGYLKDL